MAFLKSWGQKNIFSLSFALQRPRAILMAFLKSRACKGPKNIFSLNFAIQA